MKRIVWLLLALMLVSQVSAMAEWYEFEAAGLRFEMPESWQDSEGWLNGPSYGIDFYAMGYSGSVPRLLFSLTDEYMHQHILHESRKKFNDLFLSEKKMDGMQSVSINGSTFYRLISSYNNSVNINYMRAVDGIVYRFDFVFDGSYSEENVVKTVETLMNNVFVTEVDFNSTVNRIKQDLGVSPSRAFPYDRVIFLLVLSLVFSLIPVILWLSFAENVGWWKCIFVVLEVNTILYFAVRLYIQRVSALIGIYALFLSGIEVLFYWLRRRREKRIERASETDNNQLFEHLD